MNSHIIKSYMQSSRKSDCVQMPEKEEPVNTGFGSSKFFDYEDEEKKTLNYKGNSHEPKIHKPLTKQEMYDAKQLELSMQKEMYGKTYGNRNPLDLADLSSQQTDLIAVESIPNAERIWNFCVAYCAVAMGRKGTADDTIMIGNNKTTPVGLFYFAALTLFYSIEECTLGRIPPLQRMDYKLREIFYAVSPVNKQGKAYTSKWSQSIESYISNLPYHSYANPLITLAPWEAIDVNGNWTLAPENAKPVITLDDLNEIGPEAFELVQRYFLADDADRNLVAYTMNGPMDNTSMFAVPRNAEESQPVQGFGQFVNETGLPQRDVWLISLGFFDSANKRDGWNAKTVQIGTHHAIYCLLKGDMGVKGSLPTKTQTHAISFSTLVFNDLASFVTAELNSKDDRNLEDILADVTGGNIDFGYLSQISPGEILRYLISIHSRRFWLGSALAAGTPPPASGMQYMGAGSRFLTTQNSDQQMLFSADVEEMAGLSSHRTRDGILAIPCLMTRANRVSCSMESTNPESLKWILDRIYPDFKNINYNYNLKTPVLPEDPVSILNLQAQVCLTSGPKTDDAMQMVSGVVSYLQPYNGIANATGSRDGQRKLMLYLTHFMDDPVIVDDIDSTPLAKIQATLSTQPFDQQHGANVFSALFPVMYGDEETRAAYQVLFWRKYLVEADREYASYRIPVLMQRGHKRASNILAPSEYGAMVAHDTLVQNGGNFVDSIFKDGGWIDTAKMVARGIMDVIAPKAVKSWKGVDTSTAKAVRKAVDEGKIHPMHLAPVTHGAISLRDYCDAVDIVNSDEFQANRRAGLSNNRKGKSQQRKGNYKRKV
jgi:hypothetical protein